MNFYTDNPEWSWLFKNAFDWDAIIPLYYPSFPTEDGFTDKEELIAFFEELLTSTGEWSGTKVHARARRLDEAGSGKVVNGSVEISEPLKELYQEARELSIFGLPIAKK